MSYKSVTVVLRLPDELHYHLTRLARQENRTTSALVRGLLAEYVKEQTGIAVPYYVRGGRPLGSATKSKRQARHEG